MKQKLKTKLLYAILWCLIIGNAAVITTITPQKLQPSHNEFLCANPSDREPLPNDHTEG